MIYKNVIFLLPSVICNYNLQCLNQIKFQNIYLYCLFTFLRKVNQSTSHGGNEKITALLFGHVVAPLLTRDFNKHKP